ncbi:MAG: adenylate/guanylate cyclase domain-containing protein [Nanobdellota archaeon]
MKWKQSFLIRLLTLFIVLVSMLSLVSAQEYYADITIDVDREGFVTVEGLTNHPDLDIMQTQVYTYKERQYWTLNMTVDGNFSNMIYELKLPSGASVNYVKTPQFNSFSSERGSPVITGTSQDKPFSLVVQYTLAKQDTIYWMYAGVIILATGAFLVARYFLFKPSRPRRTGARRVKASHDSNVPLTNLRTQHAAVMFVDMADYTRLTANISRKDLNGLHDTFDRIIEEASSEHHGRIIKKIGDAFLLVFNSSTDAVHAGIRLQQDARKHSSEERPLELRVAVHAGEVIIRKDDVYGDAVNLASRIEGVAEKGEVVFSQTVLDLMNKKEIDYEKRGKEKFKGYDKPVKLYKVS